MKNKLKDIELFKLIYYHKGDVFANKSVIDDVVIEHGFTEQKADYIKKKFIFKKGCRNCNKEILPDDFCTAASYWNNGFFGSTVYACHKWCVEEQKLYEAYECQNIDRNCNDCAFFNRGEKKEMVTYKHHEVIKSVDVKNTPLYAIGNIAKFHGFCDKHKIGVFAHPQFATGYECFIHRRDVKQAVFPSIKQSTN